MFVARVWLGTDRIESIRSHELKVETEEGGEIGVLCECHYDVGGAVTCDFITQPFCTHIDMATRTVKVSDLEFALK